jgi:hypothetical protein
LTAPAGEAAAPLSITVSRFFPSRARLHRWAPFVVALVAVAVYANALENGYVLDDRGILLKNPLVTSVSGIWRAFANPYWPAAIGGGQYRPLVIASFSLDWWLSGGDPMWLHAVNILWHAAASVLVWFLAAELLAPAAALGAALLFAVHPVHVEAVSNVVGRSELMAAAFVLAALLAHRRVKLLAPIFFALALLSKESALVFVGLAVLHDLLLTTGVRAALRARLWLYVSYGVQAIVYGAVLLVVFRDTAVVARAPVFIGASTADRLLTMTTVIPDYARLLLVPVRLSAEYVPAVIDLATSVTWGVVMGVLLAAALAAAIFLAWRRAPEAAFALAWVPVTLTPVSNVLIVTGVVLAERTLYLPSVGAMLAVGWAVERYGWRAPRGVGAAVALVLVLFAVRTWTRTDIWHDPKTFMLTNLEENPESYKAHWSIGRVDAAAGRLPDAENEYATARELFGRDAVLWRESGELKLKTEDWAGAAAMFARAFAVAPRDTMVADATWARAVLVKPDVWQLQVGYADFLLARGDTTSARAHADRAVELSAGAPPALAVRARAKGMTP